MKKAVTNKGRPPKLKSERRSHLIRVLANSEELFTLQAAAEAAGLSLSTWVRLVSLAAAKKDGPGSPS